MSRCLADLAIAANRDMAFDAYQEFDYTDAISKGKLRSAPRTA